MFDVVTSHPVALKSLDHLFPCGTINDNSGQPDFIRKMVDLGVTSLLDIGCAGGLLVTQANDAGIRAVGIEGSDASQKAGRAEWGNPPPRYLFTADAAKPFSIHWNGQPCRFDAVTAWEVLEHIEQGGLSQLFANINRHTQAGSVLFCSITCTPSPWCGVDLHCTQKPEPWWDNRLRSVGWERKPDLETYIGDKWVRTGTFQRAYVRVK
jgi:SAM-dependent methyltransferase